MESKSQIPLKRLKNSPFGYNGSVDTYIQKHSNLSRFRGIVWILAISVVFILNLGTPFNRTECGLLFGQGKTIDRSPIREDANQREIPQLGSFSTTYQGKLVNRTNEPLTGTYNVTFALYASEESTRTLWSENHFGAESISARNGLFSTVLGAINPLPHLLFATPVFLGIQIQGQEELRPRIQLSALPFAMRTQYAPTALKLGGRPEADFLRVGEPVSVISVNNLRSITLNVRTVVTAGSMSILNNMNAREFIGNGSNIKKLEARSFNRGLLSISTGGTQSSTAREARRQLGLGLENVSIVNMPTSNRVRATALAQLNDTAEATPINEFAFKDRVSFSDIQDFVSFRDTLDLNSLAKLSGETLSGTLQLHPTANTALRFSNGKSTTMTLDKNGIIQSKRIFSNQVLSSLLVINNKPVLAVGFADTLSILNFDSVQAAKEIFSLKAIASYSHWPSGNYDLPLFTNSLQLGSISHLDVAQAEDISLTSVRTALNLKSLATQDIVPTTSINMARLKIAIGLQSVSQLNLASALYFNLPQFALDLKLQDLATLSNVTGEKIEADEWAQQLNLRNLALLDRLDPDQISIVELDEALELGELSHLDSLPIDRLNAKQVAASMNLTPLSRQNKIVWLDIQDFEQFKNKDLGLGALAFSSVLSSPHFDIKTLSTDFGLRQLAFKNTITSSDLTSTLNFSKALNLGAFAYKENITFTDMPNIEKSRVHFSFGNLAFQDTVQTQDITFEDNDLNLDQFYRKAGGLLTGVYSFAPEAALKMNEVVPAGDGHTRILFSQRGITAENIWMPGRDYRYNPGQSVTELRVTTVNTTQITLQSQTFSIKDVQFNWNGIEFQKVNMNGGLQIWRHSTAGIMYETGTNRRFDLSEGRMGLYDWETVETDNHNGLSMAGWSPWHSNERKVALGSGNGVQVRLDIQDLNDPFGYIQLNTNRLEIGKNKFKVATAQNKKIAATSSGNIELTVNDHKLTLLSNGTLTKTNFTTLLGSFNLATKEAPILEGNIELTNRQVTGNGGAFSLSPTGAKISTLSAVTLQADRILLNEEEMTFGPFATQDFLAGADVGHLIFEAIDFTNLVPKQGGSIVGPLILSRNAQIVIQREGQIKAILNPTVNYVHDLIVGEDQLTAVNPFDQDILSTRELTAQRLTINRVLTIPKLSLKSGSLYMDPNLELYARVAVTVGGPVSRIEHGGYPMSVLMAASSVSKTEEGETNRVVTSVFEDTTRLAFFVNNEERALIQSELNGEMPALEILRTPVSISTTEAGEPNLLEIGSSLKIQSRKITLSNSGTGDPTVDIGSVTGITFLSGFTLPNNFQTANTINTTLNGNGANLTQLSATNIVSGLLPIKNGGLGVASINLFVKSVDVIPENMTVGTINVIQGAYAPLLTGPTINGTPRIVFASHTTFNNQVRFQDTTRFKANSIFSKASFRELEFRATQDILVDVVITGAGKPSLSLPTLYTVNLENAREISPYTYQSVVFDYATVGAPAARLQSFGSAATMITKHYSASGNAFIAVVGGGNGNYGAPLQVLGLAMADDSAVKAIYEGNGHGIFAQTRSRKSTILASNLGTGVAFTAESKGVLPAITATSMGDTAIFALGNVQMSSSKRWKREIKTLSNSLEKVLKLQGVTYVRTDKKSQNRHIGFIAEEVGKEFPELVDYEKNGVDAIGLAYDNLTAVLVEALKEEHQEVMKLESEVNDLATNQKTLREAVPTLQQELAEIKILLQ